jgi:hypothetical protein
MIQFGVVEFVQILLPENDLVFENGDLGFDLDILMIFRVDLLIFRVDDSL